MNGRRFPHFAVIMLLGAASSLADGRAIADDVPENTVISAATIDQLKDKTFEGVRIGDMIPERLEWLIRNHNEKIWLKKSEPVAWDSRQLAKTEKYKGTVQLGEGNLINYKAGIPFPDVAADDPEIARKVIWNYYYGWRAFDNTYGPFAYVFVDGLKGIERKQTWNFNRIYMTSLNTKPYNQEGDGSIFYKFLLFATAPQDIKGLGTFTIRWNSPKLEDVWAYIRTVRRVRRLSGGAWVDPVGGSDALQDDVPIFGAHPSWYLSFNLLGKAKMLAVVNSDYVPLRGGAGTWIRGAKTDAEEFPGLDLNNAPYWTSKDRWEPRDVWVVEAVPPEYHPYSRKIMFFDAETYSAYASETYDKKGEFWKWIFYAWGPWQDTYDPAERFQAPIWAVYGDYQRMHGSYVGFLKDQGWNLPDLKPEDISLTQLEAAGR